MFYSWWKYLVTVSGNSKNLKKKRFPHRHNFKSYGFSRLNFCHLREQEDDKIDSFQFAAWCYLLSLFSFQECIKPHFHQKKNQPSLLGGKKGQGVGSKDQQLCLSKVKKYNETEHCSQSCMTKAYSCSLNLSLCFGAAFSLHSSLKLHLNKVSPKTSDVTGKNESLFCISVQDKRL